MCIVCRVRDAQQNLLRLSCLNQQLSLFEGRGRSFYLCRACVDDDKKLSKSLMRQCKSADGAKFLNKLKEIVVDERKS